MEKAFMSNYHRLLMNGGTYFFTVVTYNRQPLLCDEPAITRLKAAFKYVVKTHPYRLDALVVLPDHLHCIWTLPEDDADFSTRWNRLKRYFSIGIEGKVNHRREKHIWQHRFWEHLIRDEEDLHRCLDYIYYNPVKHGHVKNPCDWPYSTFKRHVIRWHYDINWGASGEPENIKELILE